MKPPPSSADAIGPYTGRVAPEFHTPIFLKRMAVIGDWIHDPEWLVIATGRNRMVKAPVPGMQPPLDLAIKQFGRPAPLKDLADTLTCGSKAQRSWQAACALTQRGIGTPIPAAYLERRQGYRLNESYMVTVYQPGLTSFKEALIDLFHNNPDCSRFITLLQAVADAVRAMHNSGFMHHDLGNQNILMPENGHPDAATIQFVDLNRARWQDAPLSTEQRARDLSRIWLPSDLRRVFLDMLMDDQPDRSLIKREAFHRQLFALTAETRHLRHPWRTRLNRTRKPKGHAYPAPSDLWIWDSKSEQAISALQRKERQKHFKFGRNLAIALPALGRARAVWRDYQTLMTSCWQTSIPMKNRIGMAMQPRPETWDRERALLAGLGAVPVILRFYRHESPQTWSFTAKAAHTLHEAGHAVSIALVQDRQAVNDPCLWRRFVDGVLPAVADIADLVEIGHAVNRVKWGLWNIKDYSRLVQGVLAAAERWPHLKFTGPAAIDFDPPHVVAALKSMPHGHRFHALSHHLYVDRRGAPENPQGPFSALGKFALMRAIARQAPNCEDRLIVSEVNWPLEGTGVWSPVGSPYVSPWPRQNDPSVSEDNYANFMLRYLGLAICSGMAERVYWWRLVARGFGLVDNTDPEAWRERPAYLMLKAFLDITSDSLFTSESSQRIDADPAPLTAAAKCPAEPLIRSLVFKKPDGHSVSMLYTTAASAAWPWPEAPAVVLDAFGKPMTRRQSTIPLSGRPVYLVAK